MTLVPVDISREELLRLDATMDLVFDPKAMPELDEESIRDLSYENRRSYHISFGQRKQLGIRQGPKVDRSKPPQLWIEDPFMQVADRLEKQLRPRKGWHQTWIRNDELDDFLAIEWQGMGYQQVRRPSKEQKEAGKPVEPGEEKGEVIEIRESDKVTLIQMECPLELWEQGVKASSYRSKVSYSSDAIRTYADTIEGRLSRSLGMQKERVTVVAVSMEGEETLGRG